MKHRLHPRTIGTLDLLMAIGDLSQEKRSTEVLHHELRAAVPQYGPMLDDYIEAMCREHLVERVKDVRGRDTAYVGLTGPGRAEYSLLKSMEQHNWSAHAPERWYARAKRAFREIISLPKY